MFRLMLDNLVARKFRLLSTALSVVIGVAFLVGSLVLIDTISRSFDDLFADVNQGVDAEVRSSEALETDFGTIRGRIDASVVAEVEEVPGVKAAAGSVFGYAQLVAPNGEAMGNPGQGAPTLGFSWTDVAELNPMRLLGGGRAPVAAGEVVIDLKSANDGPFAVGDSVTILLQGPPQEFEIVGIARFGTADSPLGASVALFEPATAQAVLAEPGKVDAVDVVAADGVSQTELRDRLDTALGDDLEVITGEDLTTENQNEVADALGFFNTFMLVFAAIALFVASFIIYNTFSILVAQRTRETALLRALGARRRQILGAVLMEAVAIGLIAALLGLGVGVLVAMALRGLLAAVGLALPGAGLVFAPATAVWALVVGVGVTGLAAVVPSRRASRVAPMAALRAAAVDESGQSRVRLAIGVSMLVGGVAALSWGLFGSPPSAVALVGLGMAGVFLALAVLGPVIAVPFVAVVGLPIARLGGVPGEIARENAMRSPKRTATTAAALMIGVGLVLTISVFAASAKASINKIIDNAFLGDLVIDSGTFGFGGLSPELASELRDVPGVEAASGVRLGFAEIEGAVRTLYSVDPATMGQIVDVGIMAGRIEDMGVSDIAVYEKYAEDHDLAFGDLLDVTFAETGVQRFRVSVIFERNELTGNFFIGNPAYEANYSDVFDFQVYVLRSPDADPAAVRRAVEATAARYANAEVQDLSQYKQSQAEQIDQLLTLIYGLLFLAVFIALIGIANTLALSIIERTRELGLLRAVGMTRRQLRRAVRLESVLIALLGTFLGGAVGVFFGWAMVQALADQGFSEFVVPIVEVGVIVVLAVIAGVAAAVLPARRASKLDVLRAIASS